MYICEKHRTMASIYERDWQSKFSDKEKEFLLELASTGDMEGSARKAGFSDASVSWIGKKILAKPEAKYELECIKKETGADAGSMTLEELEEEFKIIATASVTDFYDELGNVKDVTELDPEKAKAIKSVKRTVNPRNGAITVELVMHDKISALQNLGRMGGHYAADNGQGVGDVNIQIVVPGGLGAL